MIAEHYPQSIVTGSDYHEASIIAAPSRAEAALVSDRVRFDVAPADGLVGGRYDLVCMFHCRHDLGDPLSAAGHVRSRFAPDGT